MPERAVTTYRDALLHRVELGAAVQTCESDKAAARAALADPTPAPDAERDEP